MSLAWLMVAWVLSSGVWAHFPWQLGLMRADRGVVLTRLARQIARTRLAAARPKPAVTPITEPNPAQFKP